MSKVSLVACAGKDGKRVWARRDEEYVADFCLISKKYLDEFEHKVFRFHFLLGADWKLCCRQMKMDRGTFFHEIYRIQQKLGRALREVQPYALFPLDEYFGGVIKGVKPCSIRIMPTPGHQPLMPPLRKAA